MKNLENNKVADFNKPLRDFEPVTFTVEHLIYKGVKIYLNIHAANHATVTYTSIHNFEGVSFDVIKNVVTTMQTGNLNSFVLINDYVQNKNVIEFSVSFEGYTIGDIFDRSNDYLDELFKKVINQEEPAIPATT